MVLGLLLFGMNVGLWTHGAISTTTFTNTYPSVPSGLTDLNSIDQNNLVLQDSNSNNISTQGNDAIATVLDFLESIPVLGAFITLFRFAFDVIIVTTFGITLLALQLNLPTQYVVFIGAINFAVVTMGLLDVFTSFTAARGGTK